METSSKMFKEEINSLSFPTIYSTVQKAKNAVLINLKIANISVLWFFSWFFEEIWESSREIRMHRPKIRQSKNVILKQFCLYNRNKIWYIYFKKVTGQNRLPLATKCTLDVSITLSQVLFTEVFPFDQNLLNRSSSCNCFNPGHLQPKIIKLTLVFCVLHRVIVNNLREPLFWYFDQYKYAFVLAIQSDIVPLKFINC